MQRKAKPMELIVWLEIH